MSQSHVLKSQSESLSGTFRALARVRSDVGFVALPLELPAAVNGRCKRLVVEAVSNLSIRFINFSICLSFSRNSFSAHACVLDRKDAECFSKMESSFDRVSNLFWFSIWQEYYPF